MKKKHSIEHTKKLLEQVELVALDCLSLIKSGVGVTTARNLIGMLEHIRPLICEAQKSFPELADLDSEEIAELSGVCLNIVKNIVFSVVG